MSIKVQESQVEDALAIHPNIFADIVGIYSPISLLFRQRSLPSGRLDLLYAAGSELLLVELKVEPFRASFIKQVLGYADDLYALQEQDTLVQATIKPYLLCPSFSDRQFSECESAGVTPVTYSPEEVLKSFYARLQSIASFVSIKPRDHGIWNIHLINQVLYELIQPSDAARLAVQTKLSEKTIANKLRFARDLHLVRLGIEDNLWRLTDLGVKYVAERGAGIEANALSLAQRQLLRDHIIKTPFASPTIFGIYAIIECLFTLSRNSYPVEESVLLPYFRDTCGKQMEWKSPKAMMHGVEMFSNYAVELGLLAKADRQFLITPDGIRFVLLLQLHKGIAMVDALRHHEL